MTDEERKESEREARAQAKRNKIERAAKTRCKVVAGIMQSSWDGRNDARTLQYINHQLSRGLREDGDERLLRQRRDDILKTYERKTITSKETPT